MTLIAETSADPAALARPLRDVIRSMDSNMPVVYVRTMDEMFQRGPVAQLRVSTLFSVSPASWVSYSPWSGFMPSSLFKFREGHARSDSVMALGAGRSQVLNMILRQAAVVAGIGIGIGVLLSLAARPALMVAMGRPVTSFDPLMICLIPTSLLPITLLAAAIPARRASYIDPLQALRHD